MTKPSQGRSVAKPRYSAEFLKLYPAAHLLVCVLTKRPGQHQLLSNALRRYIASLAPAGAFMVTVHRGHSTPVLERHCAFETKSDALKIGKALGAELDERHGGWASQQVFQYDAARKAIGSAAKPATVNGD